VCELSSNRRQFIQRPVFACQPVATPQAAIVKIHQQVVKVIAFANAASTHRTARNNQLVVDKVKQMFARKIQ